MNHRTYAFMATKGEFVLFARQADREVVQVRADSLRLIKPTDDAWRLRWRLLGAIGGLATFGTSLMVGYLRTMHADVMTQVGWIGLLAVVVYVLGWSEERAIWPVLARSGVDSGLRLELKSIQYKRFGHRLLANSDGRELRLTVYGPRRRVERAMEEFRKPRTVFGWES